MAQPARPHWPLIAALALAIGLLHGAALRWLHEQLQTPSLLRSMPPPFFTRSLTAQAPTAPPTPMPNRVRRPAPRQASGSPALITAPPEALAPAAPAASTPVEPPTTVASAPAQTASAPTVVAQSLAPDHFDTWPADTRLSYVVGGNYRGALHGDAQVLWQRVGQRYQVQLHIGIGWLAQMQMSSQGLVGQVQLQPEIYEEITTNQQRRHVRLEPEALVLMNGMRVPRPPGVQDTVSQFVELTHRFAQAPEALAVGQTVSLWLARPGGADEWTYDVVELETLDLPRLGPTPALHLRPRPLAQPRGPITAEMWFAPSLQYLPVRIKITLNADTWLDLLLKRAEQGADARRP